MPTPQELNNALRLGQITYEQYQQAIGMGGSAPAQPMTPGGPPPGVYNANDTTWVPPPAAPPQSFGPAAGSPEEKAQFAQEGADARAATPGAPPGAPAASGAPGAPALTAPQAVPGGPAAGGGAQGQPGAQLIPYGQGAAGTVRPAGMSPADKERETRLNFMNDAEGNQSIEMIARQNALAQASADNAKALAGDQDLATAKFAEEMKGNALKKSQIAADAKERQGKIESQMASLEAQGVDPNHYWNSMGTGSKILAGIAVGLGTFGSHPLGPHGTETTNTALGIINGAIQQDIDAQKSNLNRHMELMKMRGELGNNAFDHQMALATAERDSILTANAVAVNSIKTKANLFGSNEQAQQSREAMVNGVTQHWDAKVEKLNDDIYQMHKAAERPVMVGGASGMDDKIRQRAIDIRKESGGNISPAEAQRQAIMDITGRDVQPGAGPETYGKREKAGAAGAKAAGAIEAQQSILANVKRLRELEKDAGVTGLWSPEKTAEATQLQTAIALDWNRAHGINRVGAEAEQHRLASTIIPDLTAYGSPGAREVKLAGIQQEMARAGGEAPAETKPEDEDLKPGY